MPEAVTEQHQVLAPQLGSTEPDNTQLLANVIAFPHIQGINAFAM